MRIKLIANDDYSLDEINTIARQLEGLGHSILFPKASASRQHQRLSMDTQDAFRLDTELLAQAEGCLVLNSKTPNTSLGILGSRTMMELGVASYLNKPVYIMNSTGSQKIEAEMRFTVINEDISKVPIELFG